MAKTKAKKQGAQLPKGFRAVAVGGSFGVTHDFRTAKVLEGKFLGMDTTKQMRDMTDKKGKKVQKEVSVRIMRVENVKGETVSVWESYALKNIFDTVKKGNRVYIKFLGKKKIKGGRSVNEFVAGLA